MNLTIERDDAARRWIFRPSHHSTRYYSFDTPVRAAASLVALYLEGYTIHGGLGVELHGVAAGGSRWHIYADGRIEREQAA
jgi:hypothetical protein